MPETPKDIHGLEIEDGTGQYTSEGKNYLFVIGIDAYEHCPKLHNAVKDAKDLVELLTTRFKFELENIKTLYDADATKRNIFKTFEHFAEIVTPSDNLVIYFSGHGEYQKIFDIGYWIPVEAETDAADKFIPNSLIKNILSAIKSHHTFLMVDSCFSGSLFAKSASRNISLRKERDPSRWGLTAGRNEIVTDGERGTNSPFAQSILYQLKNTNEPIGVAELCDNVLEVVSANANQTPRNEVADWKEALEINALKKYQAFFNKYPSGEYAVEAKSKIDTLEAITLWEKIENSTDNNIGELNKKLSLVNKFVDKYEDQPHYDESLNIGELLEYKRQFFLAKDSEFALRRFIKRNIPTVEGAQEINDAAKEVLSNLDKPSMDQAAIDKQEELKKKEEEVKLLAIQKEQREKEQQELFRQKQIAEEKRQAELAKEKPKAKLKEEPEEPVRISKTIEVENNSSSKKYLKYLLPILFIPFVIWGVMKLISSNGSDLPEKGNGSLELTHKWRDGKLYANINGGYTPYTLYIVKDKEEKHQQIVEKRGITLVNVPVELLKKGGEYTLVIVGRANNRDKQKLIIRPANIPSKPHSVGESKFTDPRDGQTYKTVVLKDGQTWMADNLNYKVKDSWCYNDDPANCKKYGRLYAGYNKDFVLLNPCPKGWRLPRQVDFEKLAKLHGYEKGLELPPTLAPTFKPVFGGSKEIVYKKEPLYKDEGKIAVYWTNEEFRSGAAWGYTFQSDGTEILNSGYSLKDAFSCRCIKR